VIREQSGKCKVTFREPGLRATYHVDLAIKGRTAADILMNPHVRHRIIYQ